VKRKEQKLSPKIPEPPRVDAPGYVRSAPKEINSRIVQIDGAVVGYTRHTNLRSAQAVCLEGRIETHESSIDDLMRIGKDGVSVGGILPSVDPNQQDLPIQ
jgi:hypothetical protein